MRKFMMFLSVMFGLTCFMSFQAETAFGMQQTESPRVDRTNKQAPTKSKRKIIRRKKSAYPYFNPKRYPKLDYPRFVPSGKPAKRKSKVDLSKVPRVISVTKRN